MSSLDDVQFGSHEMEYAKGMQGFPLGRAIQWFGLKTYSFNEVTVFGEAYGPGIKAKGVRYSTGQDMLFRAFDIMVGTNFLTHDLFVEVTDKMGLRRVHEVWRGEPTQEAFDALLGKPSLEARANGIFDEDNLAEGVVIRSNPLLRNVFGDWLITKYKHGKFAEVAEAPKVKPPREASPADIFASTFVTEGRLRNAVGRLSDRGVALKNDMTDMPALITEMIADLHKECEIEWKATGSPEGALKGSVSKVLGPLYRELLRTDGMGLGPANAPTVPGIEPIDGGVA